MARLFTFALLIYSTLSFGQTATISEIRFDGVYQSNMDIDPEDKDTTWQYVRFYPSGQVISVTTEGTPFEITAWFKLDFKNVSKGHYESKSNRLHFSTTSESGTVIYKGKIVEGGNLLLKTKSLINGHRAREKYYFVKVADLK
jgi:hypothetical protein